jgi:hypothetical protein
MDSILSAIISTIVTTIEPADSNSYLPTIHATFPSTIIPAN